mmetsp:Transcript_7027/g.23319  ORF Transcript_7027/g.23319 Transcript_7027/m.23319 type:complete len:220 (+) Transcript_7027:883-1542(+)
MGFQRGPARRAAVESDAAAAVHGGARPAACRLWAPVRQGAAGAVRHRRRQHRPHRTLDGGAPNPVHRIPLARRLYRLLHPRRWRLYQHLSDRVHRARGARALFPPRRHCVGDGDPRRGSLPPQPRYLQRHAQAPAPRRALRACPRGALLWRHWPPLRSADGGVCSELSPAFGGRREGQRRAKRSRHLRHRLYKTIRYAGQNNSLLGDSCFERIERELTR